MLAARKREMDDNSRRLGGLFWKLNEAQVPPHVVAKLQQMCAALDAGNWPAAQHLQVRVALTSSALPFACWKAVTRGLRGCSRW
jgi:protein transport protein SEC31